MRTDLGDTSAPLVGGGTYTMKVYLNDVVVSPNSDVTLAASVARTVIVSRPLPIEPGDEIRITVTGQSGDASINAVTTLRDVTAIREEEVIGAGPIAVDHNYGGTDRFTVTTSAGRGIEGVDIYIYEKNDYDEGRRANNYVVARVRTGVSGRWTRTLMLYAGEYTLLAFKQGVYAPTVTALTVS